MRTIEHYVLNNAKSRISFGNWLTVLKNADWNEPKDIIASYNTADNLGNNTNRVVFNIAGNNYRMICKYFFGTHEVHLYVCWIGTHDDYTELCRKNKQYSVNDY